MKNLIISCLLVLISSQSLAEQIMCVQEAFIVHLKGKTFIQKIESQEKGKILKFDFSNMEVTRNHRGKDFNRKLTEIDKGFYKEDYYLGLVIHAFNDEKTKLASTEEANVARTITYLYNCSHRSINF